MTTRSRLRGAACWLVALFFLANRRLGTGLRRGLGPGTYRVVIAVGWQDLDTGAWIASTRVEPSTFGDHYCGIPTCSTSAVGVHL